MLGAAAAVAALVPEERNLKSIVLEEKQRKEIGCNAIWCVRTIRGGLQLNLFLVLTLNSHRLRDKLCM